MPAKRKHVSRNKPLGAPPKFDGAEDLRVACEAYFSEVDEWRDHKNVPKVAKGVVKIVKVERSVPYCIERLCNHIGIVPRTWYAWKDENHALYREDLIQVIEWAENVMRAQHFEGASTETFNTVIMSRALGLADKQIVEGELNAKVENVAKHAESFANGILKEHGLEPYQEEKEEDG